MNFKKIFLIGLLILFTSIACASAAENSNDSSILSDGESVADANFDTPIITQVGGPCDHVSDKEVHSSSAHAEVSLDLSSGGVQANDSNLKLTPTKLTTTYNSGKAFNVKVEDSSNNAVSGVRLNLKIFTGKSYKSVGVTTNSNGIASYDASKLSKGTHKIIVSLAPSQNYTASSKTSSAVIGVAKLNVQAKALKTTYASGKSFSVKVTDANTKKAVSNLKLKLKVFTGKKFKTITVKTDANGVTRYSASKLSLGVHKVVVDKVSGNYYSSARTSSVKVSKAKMIIVAPAGSAVYKQNGKCTITVKHAESKKPLSGITVTVRVYTGKKYSTFNVKTNKEGVSSIPTKTLSMGKHNVALSTKANSKYYAAGKKSSITVKKAVQTKVSNNVSSGEVQKPKGPLNTTMKMGMTSFNYMYGSPAGFSTRFIIYDGNGNRVDGLPIKVYQSTYYESNVRKNWTTIKSGSWVNIPANNGHRYVFDFLGDENYLPCEYIYLYYISSYPIV